MAVLLSSLAGGAASAQPPASLVSGTFSLRFYPPGSPQCSSWDGPCLTGTATGDLSGDVFITVFPSNVVPGTYRTVSVSGARISITRPDGRLDGAASGALDTATGEHSNWTFWTGGTGRYVTAHGKVVVDGPIDLATGTERSNYVGTLAL